MANERQLRAERGEVFETLKPYLNKLARGERLSAEDQRSFDSKNLQINALDSEIAQAVEARRLSEGAAPGMPSHAEPNEAESRAFSRYLREGVKSPELRAAGEATGSAGGYMVPPGWWQRLQVALKAYGGTSNDFQLLETETGQPMQWATVDPTNIVGSLIAENTQVATQDYTFGQGTIGAYMYSSGVQLVSLQLAQDSAFDIDQFIQARVAESLGRAQAQAAISGTGSAQPLGIITALNAATGLTSGGTFALATGSKVNILGPGTGTSTTGSNQVTELIAGTLAPATFLQVLKSVDPAYRALGAKWYMNDATLQATRSIVNGFGDPYFKEIQDDVKPTLYGYPVVVDQNIPALTASTSSGIIFGHLQSAMVLRRVNGAGLMRLEERYADFLQVGYIGFQRIDVRSNDLRAAVVVKAAAS